MRRLSGRWGGAALAVAMLALVVWRVGSGAFVDGLEAVDGQALVLATAIALFTTLCCAWRWTVVARGLGVELPLRRAVAAYYGSQLLNVTVPGGVAGDVHRGVCHGREAQDVGRGLRAVAWERSAGQAVQVVLTVVVLLVLPSPVRPSLALVAGVAVAVVLGVLLLARVRPGAGASRLARIAGGAAADLRGGLLARRAWPVVALASALAVCGYAATFLIAARTAGVAAPATRVLPLALLALLAMTLPSVAGWGPREGATAWAFGAAGLGADAGVATAVVFGVMTLVASLPGAAVLGLAWLRDGRRAAAVVGAEGVGDG